MTVNAAVPLYKPVGLLGRHKQKLDANRNLAAVMPGDPNVSAVVFQGLSNAIQLYSNIILFR